MRDLHVKESKIDYFNLSKKKYRKLCVVPTRGVARNIKYVSKESRLRLGLLGQGHRVDNYTTLPTT